MLPAAASVASASSWRKATIRSWRSSRASCLKRAPRSRSDSISASISVRRTILASRSLDPPLGHGGPPDGVGWAASTARARPTRDRPAGRGRRSARRPCRASTRRRCGLARAVRDRPASAARAHPGGRPVSDGGCSEVCRVIVERQAQSARPPGLASGLSARSPPSWTAPPVACGLGAGRPGSGCDVCRFRPGSRDRPMGSPRAAPAPWRAVPAPRPAARPRSAPPSRPRPTRSGDRPARPPRPTLVRPPLELTDQVLRRVGPEILGVTRARRFGRSSSSSAERRLRLGRAGRVPELDAAWASARLVRRSGRRPTPRPPRPATARATVVAAASSGAPCRSGRDSSGRPQTGHGSPTASPALTAATRSAARAASRASTAARSASRALRSWAAHPWPWSSRSRPLPRPVGSRRRARPPRPGARPGPRGRRPGPAPARAGRRAATASPQAGLEPRPDAAAAPAKASASLAGGRDRGGATDVGPGDGLDELADLGRHVPGQLRAARCLVDDPTELVHFAIESRAPATRAAIVSRAIASRPDAASAAMHSARAASRPSSLASANSDPRISALPVTCAPSVRASSPALAAIRSNRPRSSRSARILRRVSRVAGQELGEPALGQEHRPGEPCVVEPDEALDGRVGLADPIGAVAVLAPTALGRPDPRARRGSWSCRRRSRSGRPGNARRPTSNSRTTAARGWPWLTSWRTPSPTRSARPYSTKVSASRIELLPEPVGPVIANRSRPSKSTTCGSRKAVKPRISRRIGRIGSVLPVADEGQDLVERGQQPRVRVDPVGHPLVGRELVARTERADPGVRDSASSSAVRSYTSLTSSALGSASRTRSAMPGHRARRSRRRRAARRRRRCSAAARHRIERPAQVDQPATAASAAPRGSPRDCPATRRRSTTDFCCSVSPKSSWRSEPE